MSAELTGIVGNIPPQINGYTSLQGSEGVTKKDGRSADEVKQTNAAEKAECQTCANRTYVDGSDDPGVSFKTPTKLSPAQAASAVTAHEQEHVIRNAAKAERENKKVILSSVMIFSSICPECGKSYISGGVTRTTTKKMEENDHFKNQAYDETIGKHIGKNIGKNVDEKV